MTVKDWVEVTVRMGVLPALLVVGVVAAGVCAGQVWPKARTAAYGGFWAGVLAFLAFVLALTGVNLGPFPGSQPWTPFPSALLGVVIGTWTTRFYLRWRAVTRVALPLAWQAFGALALLYLYAVWDDAAREFIGWLALGVAASSSIFYALGRDLKPMIMPQRASPGEASQVANRWYQPWRRSAAPEHRPPETGSDTPPKGDPPEGTPPSGPFPDGRSS